MLSFATKKIFAIVFILAIAIVGIFQIFQKKNIEHGVVDEILTEKITPDHIKKIIGNSNEGRKIESYSYGNGSKHIAFIGGIHGGYEWNGVFLAYEVIDYLEAHPEIIPKSLTVDIIPSMNPDGLYKVTGRDGRFTINDVSKDKKVLASGRFNSNEVDLNRNFSCKWQSKSKWQSKVVSAGTEPFSEPEAKAIKDFVLKNNPKAVIFWHSQSNGIYAGQCGSETLPGTLNIMNVYSQASKYPAVKTFEAYEVTGAAEDWLASINIPAITVELKTHETIEFDKNLSGVKAIIEYFK